MEFKWWSQFKDFMWSLKFGSMIYAAMSHDRDMTPNPFYTLKNHSFARYNSNPTLINIIKCTTHTWQMTKERKKGMLTKVHNLNIFFTSFFFNIQEITYNFASILQKLTLWLVIEDRAHGMKIDKEEKRAYQRTHNVRLFFVYIYIFQYRRNKIHLWCLFVETSFFFFCGLVGSSRTWWTCKGGGVAGQASMSSLIIPPDSMPLQVAIPTTATPRSGGPARLDLQSQKLLLSCHLPCSLVRSPPWTEKSRPLERHRWRSNDWWQIKQTLALLKELGRSVPIYQGAWNMPPKVLSHLKKNKNAALLSSYKNFCYIFTGESSNGPVMQQLRPIRTGTPCQ